MLVLILGNTEDFFIILLVRSFPLFILGFQVLKIRKFYWILRGIENSFIVIPMIYMCQTLHVSSLDLLMSLDLMSLMLVVLPLRRQDSLGFF